MKNLPLQVKYLFVESSLTGLIVFMPVAYLLFANIGLNQFQIGLLQAAFMGALLILEIPTGYLADRISRKKVNALGDLMIAFAALIYFFAGSFGQALVAEILFGLGLSLTHGADSALLKAHSEKSGLNYTRIASRLESVRFVAAGFGAIVGGLIGAYNIRWPFLLQAIIFGVAFLIALRVKDLGKKRVSKHHPIKDIGRVVKYCIHGHPRLFWRMFLGGALMTSTYFMVWFMTPTFLKASIDISWHGILFAAISVVAIAGSEFIARNKSIKMTTPFLISAGAYFVLGWQISLFTVLIFLATSFARGINTARVKPYIQEIVPEDIQATAVSVYGMIYRVMTMTLGLFVNFMGNKNLQLGLITAGIISTIFWLLFYLERKRWV